MLVVEASSAGVALACVFSTSAEYDAALIAERRAAGFYGPKRRGRRFATLAAVALALATIIILVV
jgi:DNA invertase Pin-like site-specific DNA recombinase